MRKYTNKQFDVVAFFHVIEHLEYPEKFLAELAEMMPIGSSLHFSCPGSKTFSSEFEPENKVKLSSMWDYPPLHQTRWNKKAANEILSRFGWKLMYYREEPFNWLGISTFLVAKNLLLKGLNLSDISPIAFKIKVVQKMGQIFIPSVLKQLKGMSMYCMAVRE